MFERKGFKVEDIRELRKRINAGELTTVEEIGKELGKLKEKERLKEVIKNKGKFKRQK